MIIIGYHDTLNILKIGDYEKADIIETKYIFLEHKLSFCTVYHNVDYCF